MEPLAHERIRLGDHHAFYAAVVRQVRAGAATDLEHGAARPDEQSTPALTHPPPLCGGGGPVVERREDRMLAFRRTAFVAVARSPHDPSILAFQHFRFAGGWLAFVLLR